jgi:hypothetical protein
MMDELKIVPERGAGSMMVIDNDNEGTMAWVETSLRYAREHNRSKLVKLLMVVRGEIALEMKLAKRMLSTRQESGVR